MYKGKLMELNSYQQLVINDLELFLDTLIQYKDNSKAFNHYWLNKGVIGMEAYKNNVPKTPHVCIKVPTGGGKTFIAANALQPIFAKIGLFTERPQAVVWLVPSLTILEQTLKNLRDSRHPYRQKLNTHFSGRVEVYSKQDLLQAASFSARAVEKQLSILILSFDTLRCRKKEDRKIFQENGQLLSFAQANSDNNHLLAGVDETALINVIRKLNPVLIVDESHNAESDLSVEMLSNLNPSFILDLTATPRKNSNIISFVNAFLLKKENMVKLPVIVHNNKDKNEVIDNARALQERLEQQALEEHKQGGAYIRPIVLFQAQPKNAKDSTTFEKIKQELLDLGIPENQIKIKTAAINELKGIELLDKACPVRFIITVNALKEGWDCPFAYILASLADKSSAIDVEQILGRILRQPYAVKHQNSMLNLSYVLTASNQFLKTLDSIVEALNKAGFSRKDYKIAENFPEEVIVPDINKTPTVDIFTNNTIVNISETDKTESEVSITLVDSENNAIIQIAKVVATYEKQALERTAENEIPIELEDKMPRFYMKAAFKSIAQNLILPQFFQKIPKLDLFNQDEGDILLSKDSLLENFHLSHCDINFSFEDGDTELYKVDINETTANDYKPEFIRLDNKTKNALIKHILAQPHESQIRDVAFRLSKAIGDLHPIEDRDINGYVSRILETLNSEQIHDCLTNEYQYSRKIKAKIRKLMNAYAEKSFYQALELDQIFSKSHYQLTDFITPGQTAAAMGKSLYESEEAINQFEEKVINKIANLDNVLFWHRNPAKNGFSINAFINHYPDFVVQTVSGKTLLIETKGDVFDNDESASRIKLGKQWANHAGKSFKYFMIFETKQVENAYPFDEAIKMISNL